MNHSTGVNYRVLAISSVSRGTLPGNTNGNIVSPKRGRVRWTYIVRYTNKRRNRNSAISPTTNGVENPSNEPSYPGMTRPDPPSNNSASRRPLVPGNPNSNKSSRVLAHISTASRNNGTVSSRESSGRSSSYKSNSSTNGKNLGNREERRSKNGGSLVVKVHPSRNSDITDDTETDTAARNTLSYRSGKSPTKPPWVLDVAEKERIVWNKTSNYTTSRHTRWVAVRNETSSTDKTRRGDWAHIEMKARNCDIV